MSRASKAVPLWDTLARDLAGSFTARARSLLAAEFTLLGPDGEEFGWLHLDGTSSAELRSGSLVAAFEASGGRYRMVADGEEALVASPKRRSIDDLELSCGGRTYEAQVSFLRNLAVASHLGGERAARLSGGLIGHSYEALFAENGCALSIAIFLLWHTAANRCRAYRRGGTM